MRKITKIIVFTIFAIIIVLVFVPVTVPSLETGSDFKDNDLIIIFNSGGWGDATMEESGDFLPIVLGIRDSLNEWGHNAVIVPYKRAKDGVFSKFPVVKDFFSGYSVSSEKFAKDIESILQDFPDKKIILTGLSNGAAFINETYVKSSKEVRNSLYAISVGIPFWAERAEDENIIHIDNNGKDALSEGEIMSLLATILKTPFNWLSSIFTEKDISLAKAFKVEGHEYSWPLSETKEEILLFLEEKIR